MTSPIDQGEALAALAAKLTRAQRWVVLWLRNPATPAKAYAERPGWRGTDYRKIDALVTEGLVYRDGAGLRAPTAKCLALREHIQTNMEGERG